MKSHPAAAAGPLPALLAGLDLLAIETRGAVLHVRLNRPAKRNAVSDALVAQLHTCFVNLPEATRAVVLSGAGDHFCAGLDLAEVSERSVAEGIVHSRSWHAAFQEIQFGRVPGSRCCTAQWSVAGSSWPPLATVRVAEASAFYGLPEGARPLRRRGGSARIPRLIGAARMTDMSSPGVFYDAAEASRSASRSTSSAPARASPRRWRWPSGSRYNAPLSNFAVMHPCRESPTWPRNRGSSWNR